MRLVVASSATCLAPSSQNSKCERSPSGSGQAQPGQSTPSFWFNCKSVRVPRPTPISANAYFVAMSAAVTPPATLLIGLTSGGADSSGGCASGTLELFAGEPEPTSAESVCCSL